jgi:glutamine---fructose-6-phosphate transaminase (isomerizing)
MCGIVGYVGKQNAGEILLDGLRRLEYRGYDSAGMAVIANGGLDMRRSVGKISALETLLREKPLEGRAGLGHTRWATHGRPSEENAHPHQDCTGRIVVVHNGIIENYTSLKAELLGSGHAFASQTDTEVISHLVEECLRPRERPLTVDGLLAAVREATSRLKGAYALGILCADLPDVLVAARKDCPLILGIGTDEILVASDIPAILARTREAVFLDEGEAAVLRAGSYRVVRLSDGAEVHKSPVTIRWDILQAEKAGYRHFMLKEIHEQPGAIEDTLRGRLNLDEWQIYLDTVKLTPDAVRGVKRILIVACGTSWHAGLIGKFLVDRWLKIPCETDIASEFRYRGESVGPDDLFIAISQSGETADTIAALRYAKEKGARTLAICNVAGSTIAREAHGKVYTRCGPEIGVASTKAFTTQVTVLYLLALFGALVRDTLSRDAVHGIMTDLLQLPRFVTAALKLDDQIAAVAKAFHKSFHFLFLGRNLNYPIALEGALKLKEISYIHAEGYPAGELKHGPIALIDEKMPVLAIATRSPVYEKVLGNVEEAKARGGTVIALATEGDREIAAKADHVWYLPAMPEFLTPCVNAVPLQLFAYHVAVLRGCDVDQPRNLAKSVTVE